MWFIVRKIADHNRFYLTLQLLYISKVYFGMDNLKVSMGNLIIIIKLVQVPYICYSEFTDEHGNFVK